MNKFAFVSNKKQQNQHILQKHIKTHGIGDLLKISVLNLALVTTIFLYLYYVTLASTRGYFLRQANQKHKEIEFQYEILKTELLSKKQLNREQMHTSNTNNETIKIRTEVVRIPSPELTQHTDQNKKPN